MLPRQDSRDAVVSVDPPALVEAVEQVNTDLTIGRGLGNAQSSAKRARTVNCSGTAPTSIDSYDKSLHDEMERYFAVPLDQFALDQLTADLGADTTDQNRPEAGLASSEAYDKSMHDEMESYFRKPLDQFIADLEAETSSAAGFSTGNSTGSTIGDTELWSFDEADEKSILITHFGQQTALGFVSRWWQHVALVVMTVLGLQAVFEPIYNHASSTEAGSRLTASILEALGSKILPLLWLGLGILLGAAAYCYLPVWTKHSLRNLSLEAHEAYTMNAIHKKILRHYCAVLPLTHLYKFCLALWSLDRSGSLISGKTLILFFRHFFAVTVFIAVVFWFQVTYATIMRVRTLVILAVTASRALQHPAILAIPVRIGLVSVVLLAVELCDAPDIPNNSLERMCLYIGNNVGGSRAGWGGVAVCFACVLCTYTWHCCVVRQVSVDVSFQQAVRKEELPLLKFAKLKITIT